MKEKYEMRKQLGKENKRINGQNTRGCSHELKAQQEEKTIIKGKIRRRGAGRNCVGGGEGKT